jgi:hypothetical protein
MRIISQDGTIDVPYNFFSVSIASGKYKGVEYGCIYCHNISAPHGTKLAEYSSKEKALKVMEMLRDHHEKVAFLKTVINTEKGTQFVRSLSETNFDKMTQNYFQFPKDDEVQV